VGDRASFKGVFNIFFINSNLKKIGRGRGRFSDRGGGRAEAEAGAGAVELALNGT
jgi:hypothetical protein